MPGLYGKWGILAIQLYGGLIKRKGLRQTNIYLDGPEATGKTTLAKMLEYELHFNYTHLDNSCPNTKEYHELLMLQNRSVFDRFCLSEVVYSKIYNRVPKLSFEDCLSIINGATPGNDLFIILYTSDISILKDRLKRRKEYEFLDEIDRQNKEFITLCNAIKSSGCLTLITWDIVDGYDDLYNLIRKFIKEREHE